MISKSKITENQIIIAGIIILTITALGLRYYTVKASENHIKITVDCRYGLSSSITFNAESDINKYCEDQGLPQRFKFIQHNPEPWSYNPGVGETGGSLPDKEWENLVTQRNNLLIGQFGIYSIRNPKEMLESNNLFLINNHQSTSKADFTSNMFNKFLL